MIGTVQAIGKSRSGKPTVTIDGQVYSASKVDLGTLQIGDKIEADTASSIYNGATVWFLNAWKLLEGAKKYPTETKYPPSVPPAQQPNYAPSASNAPTEGERLTLSNWIGQGIASGAIKTPEEVDTWYRKLRALLRSE